jgi:hypothetical protein
LPDTFFVILFSAVNYQLQNSRILASPLRYSEITLKSTTINIYIRIRIHIQYRDGKPEEEADVMLLVLTGERIKRLRSKIN